MSSIHMKVWRDEEEDLWYWKASSDEEGEIEGYLPDLSTSSTRSEVVEAALETFREETESDLPDDEFEIRVRGLVDGENDSDEDWGEDEEISSEDNELPEGDENESEEDEESDSED